jgi:hypothetical protein
VWKFAPNSACDCCLFHDHDLVKMKWVAKLTLSKFQGVWNNLITLQSKFKCCILFCHIMLPTCVELKTLYLLAQPSIATREEFTHTNMEFT